jgi:GINS complex subunit 3
MGYLDIDDILCEEERVEVVLNVDKANNMGYLDPSSATEDLEKGAKIELPFWLTEKLISRNIVGIQLPNHYGNNYRKHLRAGARAVGVREKSPHYFQVNTCPSSPSSTSFFSFLLLLLSNLWYLPSCFL